jgi:nucleotide-binding universal stress UspA family protein
MSFRRILVASDFSEPSERALDLAIGLALKFDADLTLVHSWEAPAYSYGGGLYFGADLVLPIERAAVARLDQALAELKVRLPKAKSMLRSGPAWQEVLAAATQLHADLIVLGTHGRRGLQHALLGSVAERVVRMAEIPVLTTHGSLALR